MPRPNPAPRFLCVLSLAAAFGAATGACDRQDPGAEAHRRLAGAEAALRAAGTATVHFDVALDDAAGYDSVHWAGTSRMGYGTPAVTSTEFSTASAVQPDVGAGGLTTVTHTVRLRELIVDADRYHSADKLRTPNGQHWVHLPAGNYVSYGPQVANPDLGPLDPMVYLGLLANTTLAQAVLGDTGREERIDGVAAHRYHIACTLGHEGCPATALPPVFTAMFAGACNVEIDVWLDGDGRPRKLEASGDLDTGRTVAAGGGTIYYTLRTSMTFSDFGTPVDAAAPPADDVTTTYTLRL
jgi:hypothetical protein